MTATTDVGQPQAPARRVSFSARRVRSTALIVLADVLLINLAFALGYYVRYQLQLFSNVPDGFNAPYSAYIPFQLAFTVMMLLFLALDGVYRRRREGGWFEALYRIGNATTTATVMLIAGTFLLQPLVYSRLLPFEVGVLTITLLSGARLAWRVAAAQLRKRGLGLDRVLIVGAGEIGRAVMRNLVARPELGYQVVGFVDDDLSKGDLGRFKALGGLDSVGSVMKSERVDEMIITLPWMYHRTIMGLVRTCQAAGVRARVVPDLFQLSLSRVDFDDMGGIPLMGLKATTIPRAGRLIKRAMDFAFALAALALTSPLLLLLTVLVRLDSPGPALFKQRRVGHGGQPFDIYKFRTMRQGAEAEEAALKVYNESTGPLFKMRADPRITGIGGFLRRSSLDELPQFINVLRGEMSVVGPRPGRPAEVAEYQPWHRQRLEVPPGITGLWQVSGRSDLTFDEMCLLDVYYIENWSLGLDLSIMLRTVPRVLLRGRGVLKRTKDEGQRTNSPPHSSSVLRLSSCLVSHMPLHIIIGAQWGDEGKGRVTDLLAADAHVVARYSGGDNAGHTVTVAGPGGPRIFKLHLLPSGLIQPHVTGVLGHGMVINPARLLHEMAALRDLGIEVTPARVKISAAAHLITPAHIALDQADEAAREAGEGKIGTTGRGIGPAYTDKTSRRGLRAELMADPERLGDAVAEHVRLTNQTLERIYHQTALDPAKVAADYTGYARELAPYLTETSLYLHQRLSHNAVVLAEGAQGTLLDLDLGTYPFVTSSSPTSGGAFVGLGVAPRFAGRIIGVTKAFQTRVGEGPFPTEAFGAEAERLRGTGANPWDEFGTTTGRPRRCGWLDLVLLRYALRINGVTELVLTKLDVLTGLSTIQLGVGYQAGGQTYSELPMGPADLSPFQPIYESLPGWTEDLSEARTLADLPAAARAYVARLEELTGVPVSLVSVGPERSQIVRAD